MTEVEERGDPRTVQEIRRLVTACDRPAVLEYIRGIAEDELGEGRTWFAKSGRSLLRDDADWRIQHRARRGVDLAARETVRDAVTVVLSSPSNAAKLLPWRNLASSQSVQVLTLVDVLVLKGGDWCRSFVKAAIARNAKADRDTAAAVIRYCLPLILHFAVPTDDMPAYPRLWALYYGQLRWVHDVWDAEAAERFAYPGWGGLQFRISKDGSCQILPRTQKQLLELLDLDDTAPGALMRCFDIPDALAPFKGTGIGDTLSEYIRRGVLSRDDVLQKTETALSRSDGTPNQRLLAEVLAALSPAPQEVASIIPLLLSTVGSAAGFLSFQALELLLTAPLTGGDLRELSAAVFGRTEKKSQVLLSRHLKSVRADEFDSGVLRACWEEAAASADVQVRTRAESMLGFPGTMTEKEHFEPSPLWGTGARQAPEVPLYVALDVDPANPLPWWSSEGKDTVVEEQYLDRFLRAVYHAPQDFRDWYKHYRQGLINPILHGPLPQVPDYWMNPDPDIVLAVWASGKHNLTAHTFLAARLRASTSGPWNLQDYFCCLHALAVVRRLRLSELTVQAGTIAYSLATPSFSDFRVELDRLVRLLELYAREGWQYGEADFFQALLRLGPVDRRLAATVPDIEVMPLGGSAEPGRQAGKILREWIDGGGFVPPAANEAPVIPISLDRFPSIPHTFLSVDIWTGGKEWQYDNWLETASVVPFWPDLGAVWSRGRHFYEDLVRRQAGELAGATAGGLGLLTHEWLLTKLAAPDSENAIGTTLELARRRLLRAEHLALAARNRLNAGAISVGRLTRNLALVAHEGHLDVVWPAFAALVAAAVALPKLPAGTPELLATCSELWEAIPLEQRTSPDSATFTTAVLKLAAAKTPSKSSLEAKRLAAQVGIRIRVTV